MAMRVVGWTRRRAWPLGVGAAFVVLGMAWSFLYLPLRHGAEVWDTPPDLWATFRAAQFTAWGGFGAIYSAGTYLVTLPGIAVALAPLALLCDSLHLTEGFPFVTAHPTAWFIVGPVTMAAIFPLLLAVRSVAERLNLGAARQRVAVIGVALLSVPELVVFGHPEDTLAVALAIYSALALDRGKVGPSAWLMGASLAMQPLTFVAVPVLIGYLGLRRAAGWLTRAALFPGLLVAIVLAADWKDALPQLLHQPNYPTANANHATPWVSLAAVTGHHVVAAGPGRIVALCLALTTMAVGWRWRGRLDVLLIGMMLALAVRVPLEAVEVPFYLTPGLTFAWMLVVRSDVRRQAAAAVLLLATSVVSFFHYGPWSYWLLMTGLFVAAIGVAIPGGSAGRSGALAGDGGEHAVDEATRVLRRVELGQLDSLVDDDAHGRALVLR